MMEPDEPRELNPDEAAGPIPPVPPGDKDAWKVVYFGQLSRDLVPYHPDPPEAPEDELTQAALSDPENVTRDHPESAGPTFWRVLVVVAVAIASLAMVFWRTH